MKVFREPVVPKSQMLLLPPSVNDYVPKNSPARIVSEIIDSMNHDKLYAKYRGGGAPAYDPKIMLKLIVFGYSQVRKSAREGFVYDEEKDEFTCPEGAKIEYLLACTGHNIGKIARCWVQGKALVMAG